jgi:hypothetical protein
MTDLTLKQLREAMYVIRTSKKFAGFRGCLAELILAEAYMLGEDWRAASIAIDSPTTETPRDPRKVLT